MDDIIIENIWSNPKENAHFLDWYTISIQVRNISDKAVRIEKVECRFIAETEDVFAPYTTKPVELEPRNLSSPISIEFEASLLLKNYTNVYNIRVHYKQLNESQTIDCDPRKYIILHPRGASDKFFFISHKDPEDSDISRILRGFLKKLGYEGYIAEDDHNPGVELWDEKIPQKIEACLGIIVLWTSTAKKMPDGIIREIALAKAHKKRIIFLKEEGLELPEQISDTTEYLTVRYPIPTASLIDLVLSLERMDTKGRFLV